jgi:hypothetical protein
MQSDPKRWKHVEDVIEALQAEVIRRIGQTFTTIELLDEYDRSDPWATQLAHETAPESPYAWESGLVVDATFHRLERAASDYTP